MVRTLEATAARVLCAGAAGELATGPAHGRQARRRTAAWYVLHLFLGGVVSGMSLAIPPAVIALLFFPAGDWQRLWFGAQPPPAPLIALGLVVLLVSTSAAAGSVLARCAPRLLGPTPDERLAAAEQRALVLAQRNRLARELHDSVGHALSAVTIQAAAAGRVLGENPEFAAEALRAIEETARAAVGELDTVLGLLRAEEPAGVGPTLDQLPLLIRQLELAGVTVESHARPGLATDREREVLRLITAGLTNGEIAERLLVSPETVKTHVASVLAKLGARDRTQAVIIAYESGFVQPG